MRAAAEEAGIHMGGLGVEAGAAIIREEVEITTTIGDIPVEVVDLLIPEMNSRQGEVAIAEGADLEVRTRSWQASRPWLTSAKRLLKSGTAALS